MGHARKFFHVLPRAYLVFTCVSLAPDLVQQHRVEWNQHFLLPDASLVLTQP